jgi:hypothetical protein
MCLEKEKLKKILKKYINFRKVYSIVKIYIKKIKSNEKE